MLIMSADQCAAYVEALKDGLGVGKAMALVGVSRSAVVNTCKANPEFLAACEDAKSTRAAALLELAETATIDAAEDGSAAKAAMAKSLTGAATALAEKLAPREYGPKLAFDGEGGAAIVQVISFARPTLASAPEPAPIPLEAHDDGNA